MTRPRLLDLFCGAGGAAMGYHRAGFDVVGVDTVDQPHYPFTFYRNDAMQVLADLVADTKEYGPGIQGWAAIHASPPCQGYSRMRHLPWLRGRTYPMLIEPVRKLLEATGIPWVIENVEDAPMPSSTVLCGWSLGLPIYRHRRFGSSFLIMAPSHLRHPVVIGHGRRLNDRKNLQAGVAGVVPSRTQKAGLPVIVASLAGHTGGPTAVAAQAMGIDWMTRDELTQAIPPAYTEHIGRQLIASLERAA